MSDEENKGHQKRVIGCLEMKHPTVKEEKVMRIPSSVNINTVTNVVVFFYFYIHFERKIEMGITVWNIDGENVRMHF